MRFISKMSGSGLMSVASGGSKVGSNCATAGTARANATAVTEMGKRMEFLPEFRLNERATARRDALSIL